MCWAEGVVKNALRGDDLGTPLAKNLFSGDGGRGRFAKGLAKAKVTEGLFSVEEIIHFAIVTAGALFGQPSSLLRPFLASVFPNPSPRSHFLAFRAILPSAVATLHNSAAAYLTICDFRWHKVQSSDRHDRSSGPIRDGRDRSSNSGGQEVFRARAAWQEREERFRL